MNLILKHLLLGYVFIAIAVAGSVNVTAQEIVLKRQVALVPGLVRLGDLTDVHSPDQQKGNLLRSLPIKTFSGEPETLSKTQLSNLLRSQGLDLSYWKVSGSKQVQITKGVLRSQANNQLSSNPKIALRNQTNSASSQYPPRTVQNTRNGQNVRAGNPQQQNGLVSGNGVGRGGFANGMKTRPSWARPARHSNPNYQAPRSPTEQKVFRAGYKKKAEQKTHFVWGAAQDIPAGKMITPSMLTAVEVTRNPDSYFHNAEGLFGKEAIYRISAGKPIRSSSVRIPRMIRRNDKVRLLIGVGPISVSRTVVAKEDGGKGEVIKLESADRKKTYFGKVIRSGVAVLAQDGPEKR